MRNKSTTLTLAAMLCLGMAPRQVLAVSPAEIAFPVEEGTSCEHTYSNGFCTQCGEPQADYLKPETGAPDKPCGVGRADANPKLLLNDT